jgi:hypothetical protein
MIIVPEHFHLTRGFESDRGDLKAIGFQSELDNVTDLAVKDEVGRAALNRGLDACVVTSPNQLTVAIDQAMQITFNIKSCHD